ncbi:hypothetical protein CBR_g38563 [Chara braunii]|uniref:Myb-like domain-containing protein n=1 Tax=Chara braunii TaxID=69332 RepID=A0A388K0E6_CHABU|nr:hypothetical protein CBR_g38563 [Chara braunii]|eukprot:GBG63495.1 hypothetical protein CBR_g38563 [Chara braunii]
MVDHSRKLSLLCVLVLLLLLLLILHLWSSRRARVVPCKWKLTRSSKHPACKGGMGAGDDEADMFMYGGMGGGGECSFPSDTPCYDPALYAHLPPHLQPLPDDDNWQPPPSTFDLAHGSTQSISDSGVWVRDQRPRQGPMTSLLFDGLQQGMCPLLDLQLSSGGRPAASRTLIINPASRSEGDASVGQSARRPGGASLQTTAALANTNIHAVPTVTRPSARVRASSEGREAHVVDDIIAKETTWRTKTTKSMMEPWPKTKSQKKTSARKPAPKGRAKGKAKDGDGESGGGRIIWSLDDSIALVRCKREQDETLAAAGHNFARMKTKQWKWTDIGKRMEVLGVNREWDVCMKRWENIFSWYKKVQWREKESGLQSFFTLTPKERADKGYKFQMDRRLYEAIHAGQHGNQTIHPPNVVDTRASEKLGANNGGMGETSASDNGDGEAGKGCASRSSSGMKFTKRKNARQQAFEAVTDVMSTHSIVVADSVDRASKRQCDVLQRQCDIMEREVKVEETQCGVMDAGQRMLCDALLKIAEALSRPRGNSHGREMEFDHHVNHEDFRYYKVDANAVTCLAVVVGFGFGRRALREVIMHITRVGTAVPTRFVGGVDVLAEMVRMMITNFAMEFRDRLHRPATYTVVLHEPFEQREDLHGDIDILRKGMF